MERHELNLLHTSLLDERQDGASRALRRDAAHGAYVRVARGSYAPADEWHALDPRERHCVRALLRAERLPPRHVLSHVTAAALWGLPIATRWPDDIDVTVDRATGGRSEGQVRRHATGLDDLETRQLDGVTVTSPAQTAVDIALALPLRSSVVVLDAVLSARGGAALATKAELERLLDTMTGRRGIRRARAAVDFADGRAESPGESMSRAVIHELGFPPPILQEAFFDRDGLIGRVDFWWPEHNLIGEFDGMTKYLSPELRGGRTAEQVVVTEKRREDRLRANGPRVARWITDDLRRRGALRAILLSAGLPITHRRPSFVARGPRGQEPYRAR
ncbi:type IV toxin-antitoxin system AbiEi family antitoxin domain-containing protein [Compostimonas suwonensis]|nr:type IV toxin-antitoxin system AbiEi family antitoxin [Compostimonas suwonensis]